MTYDRIIPAALTLFLPVLLAACAESPSEPGSASNIGARSDNALSGESNGGVTVPVTGETEGGKFQGTLTITGAAFDEQIGPILLGRIRGTLVTSSSGSGAPSENVFVNYSDIEIWYADHVKTDSDCIVLEFSPPSVTDNETKKTIEFDTSALRSYTLPGPANLIANLICAVDGAVEAGWSLQEGPA